MGIFSENRSGNSGESAGMVLMLGELRDLRGTIDKHDERLRGEIGGVKQSVSDLSQAVLRSQGDVGAIRTDVNRMDQNFDAMKTDLTNVKTEVHELKTARDLDDARWAGPESLGKKIIFVSATFAAFAALVKFWPAIWVAFGG